MIKTPSPNPKIKKRQAASMRERKNPVKRKVGVLKLKKIEDKIDSCIHTATENNVSTFDGQEMIFQVLELEKKIFDKFNNGELSNRIILLEYSFFQIFKWDFFISPLLKICHDPENTQKFLWSIKDNPEKNCFHDCRNMYRKLIDFLENLNNSNIIEARVNLIHLLNEFTKFNDEKMDFPHHHLSLSKPSEVEIIIDRLDAFLKNEFL